MDFSVGDIVYSKAGRDSARYYIVTSVSGEYITMCDGDLRPVSKPKKKKIKHLKNMGVSSDFIKGKIESGDKVTNSELRRAIAEFEDMRKMNAKEEKAQDAENILQNYKLS